MQTFKQRAEIGLSQPESWLYIILIVGGLLRLHQYLLDRSLWIDEAFLALNIIERSYSELLQPLAYNQAAPIGFLIIEKFMTQLWSSQEYALRLLPFLASLSSLFLFFSIVKLIKIKPTAAAIALGLFALCDRLIYYSAEVKQYSTDVAVALLLCWFTFHFKAHPPSKQQILVFALVAALSVWLSHPAVFVIAGTGLCLIAFAVRQQPARLLGYLAAYGLCAVSFALFYQFSLSNLVGNSQLQDSWGQSHNAFMPLPPTSLTELKWFFDTFFRFFNYPIGIELTGVAAFGFIMGGIALFKRQKFTFWALIAPLVVTLLASGLQKYPFQGQLLLFAVPFALLIIAVGAQEIIGRLQPANLLIPGLLILLLFSHPFYYAALNLNDPNSPPKFEYQRMREEIKPALAYLKNHWQAGDTLYVYYAAQHAFRYYAKQYGFDFATPRRPTGNYSGEWFEPALVSNPPQLIVGSVTRYERDAFAADLRQLRQYPRVWLLFSHVRDRRSSIDEETVLLSLLSSAGQEVDSFHSLEAAVYLFNMNSNTDETA
ncbi:hypothetical protein [Almyronema epifaneia]|uniref:Glycosyltransferase RgtA/B/C/D-like domain-containing protein n=1 Tax=Almyronema epifaneia S1 TaxID=2991925 RepID=A0ABW6I927_9CYAN